jgi:hypothetical protein
MSMFAAILFAASGATFGFGPEWRPVADPLAEARAGKLYCDTPDHKAKTCEAGALFRFGDDGEILAAMMIPINNEPDLAIAFPVRNWIEDGALCARPEQADIDRMRLMMGTRLYETPAGEKLLDMFKEEFAKMAVGKTLCEHIFTDGARLLSVGTVDGVHLPELDGEIAWLGEDSPYDLRASENMLEE